jgi:hypothetical protein
VEAPVIFGRTLEAVHTQINDHFGGQAAETKGADRAANWGGHYTSILGSWRYSPSGLMM